ncbi:hypothetical protein [Sphingobacterium daejeonense]|uniref:hypothetical protein n=1 Tax=Sphingobacterium daejeonense TaxID=371142 RepID=UPI0010FE9D54|nr:hypothetical protein [Sphingobacterium daejeonense]
MKQAINAFLFDYMGNANWIIERNPANLDRAIFKTILDFSDFKQIIRDAYSNSKQKKKVVSNFIPTGLFWPTVMIASDKGNFPLGI